MVSVLFSAVNPKGNLTQSDKKHTKNTLTEKTIGYLLGLQ